MTFSSGVENSPQSPAAAPDAAPGYDRAPTDEDLLCPLCEYNLRGATEPRCPECGFRFEWRDLLDPERRRHEYVFEHHPRHNLWSFRRTLFGTLRPRRFWQTLRPGQPSNPKRLILYWLAVTAVALALPVGLMGLDMARLAAQHHRYRASYGPPPFTGPTKALLDQDFPVPPQPEFFRRYFVIQRYSITWALYRMEVHWTLASAAYLAWPWLTFLALLVFQISMRRARVKPVHVLRCVMYTFDATALLAWGLLLMAAGLFAAAALLPTTFQSDPFELLLWVAALIILLTFTYRLSIAYRLYLQFPHAVTTVVTSQVIAILATVAALFVVSNIVWPVRS